jgi:transposase InsO family protein
MFPTRRCSVREIASPHRLNRAPSQRQRADILLGDRIEVYHRRSRGTYRRPRIQADLRDEGVRASDKRVARIMRERGLHGASRRKGFKTTIQDRAACAAPDLVKRDFKSKHPDQIWVPDITYVPTLAGFLFLAVVREIFSRRVVGWAMATHLRTELVLDALDMAVQRRRPKGVFITPIRAVNIPRLHLESAALKLRLLRRPDLLEIVTTTPCAKALTQRWNANCLRIIALRIHAKRRFRSSTL